MNKMGFELSINGKKYLVKCDTSIITNTSERDTSNKVNLRIRVFEDGEFIKLDRDSYVAEKITDFIRNCINGQDNIYWDWDEPNRHLDKPNKIRLGCPLEVIEHLIKGLPIFYENNYGMNWVNTYNISGNAINFDCLFNIEEGKDMCCLKSVPLNEYKKRFWLKEDKSE